MMIRIEIKHYEATTSVGGTNSDGWLFKLKLADGELFVGDGVTVEDALGEVFKQALQSTNVHLNGAMPRLWVSGHYLKIQGGHVYQASALYALEGAEPVVISRDHRSVVHALLLALTEALRRCGITVVLPPLSPTR